MTGLSQRQKQILFKLVDFYIKEAQPISSLALAKTFNLSSATLRNEMVELDQAGLVIQPHPSAGRVPSEAGFRYYIKENLQRTEPDSETQKSLKLSYRKGISGTKSLKTLAKKISEISNDAVIIAFNETDIYYTGLSYLFRQPEFNDYQLILNCTALVDHLDEVINRVFLKFSEVTILIGDENPFGANFGALVTSYNYGGDTGLMAMLGPIRMNYDKNLGLLNYSKRLIEQKSELYD